MPIFRHAAAAAMISAGLAACAQTAPPVATVPVAQAGAMSPAQAKAALYALFAASDAALLERSPISRLFRGDYSRAGELGPIFDPAATDQALAAAEAELAALEAIDRSLLGPEDQTAYDVFAYQQRRVLELKRPEVRRFADLLPLDHMNGFHINYPRFSTPGGIAPFKTTADYEAGLQRHAQYPAIIDRAIAAMRQGMAQGVVQPRQTVEKMIGQLDNQLAGPVEQSPFWLAVSEMPDSFSAADRARFTAAYRTAITGDVRGSLTRLRRFLADEYLPQARAGHGLDTARDGAALYEYAIAENTTLAMSADDIHALGLSEVARINAALAEARREAGARKPIIYRDKGKLTEAWYAIGKRVDHRMPELFATIPKTPLEIRPYEPYREATDLAASYSSGDLASGKPGIFYFSGYNLANRTVTPTVALYMHEGNPGHHFQIMTAYENDKLPEFLRYGGYNAYAEGWGLYAESLGYELGLYDDPIERIGALAGGELLRAVRLVVDTGIHAKGWDAKRAYDYMVANGQEPAFAASEVARYSVMPGQALGYKLGELTIKRLRKKAESQLGDRFDVRDFHRVVLEGGSIPLSVLEAKVDRWIAGGGG